VAREQTSSTAAPASTPAFADARDTVQSNCEIVHGLPAPPVPPPPPPPPPPTTTTATTTPNLAKTGTYCGFTNAGGGICFDITGPPLDMLNLKFEVTVHGSDCNPSKDGTISFHTGTTSTPLGSNNQFTYVARGGNSAGTTVAGQLDTAGNASGTIHFQGNIPWTDGSTPACALDTTWTAKLQ